MGDFHSIDSPIKCNLFGKYSFLRISYSFSFPLLVAVIVVLICPPSELMQSYDRLAGCCKSILDFVILIACAPSSTRNSCDFAFSALSRIARHVRSGYSTLDFCMSTYGERVGSWAMRPWLQLHRKRSFKFYLVFHIHLVIGPAGLWVQNEISLFSSRNQFKWVPATCVCVCAYVARTRFHQFIARITRLTERDRLRIRALYHKRIAHRPFRKLYRETMCFALSNCCQPWGVCASISIYFLSQFGCQLPPKNWCDLFKSVTFDSFYSIIMLSAYEMNPGENTLHWIESISHVTSTSISTEIRTFDDENRKINKWHDFDELQWGSSEGMVGRNKWENQSTHTEVRDNYKTPLHSAAWH